MKEVDYIEKLTISPNYRYERKFTIQSSSKMRVINTIKTHPAFFAEIFSPRTVNNIYFDTPNLQFYKDNIEGTGERMKIRIRWYGDTFGTIKAPKLEFKIKNGFVGDKWAFDLPGFELKKGLMTTNFKDLFLSAKLPGPFLEKLHLVHPVLLNNYYRRYFLSKDGNFRITVDEDLCYYKLDKYFNPFIIADKQHQDIILELKYPITIDSKANAISNLLSNRVTKHSKYVNGINQVYFNNKQA